MKHLFIMGVLVVLGCQPKPTEQKKQGTPIIVGHVFDLTKSTVQLTYFDSNAAKRLYYQTAVNGGTVKLIRVTDNSTRQDVYTMQVPHLDTQATGHIQNVYQRARVAATNTKAIATFTMQAQEEIRRYITATQGQLSSYTDLTNALALAKTALQQPTYAGYKKYLLICSDMENDPKGKRHAPLEPIDLPHTIVLIVRPTLSAERLKELFPLSRVYVFTNVNDAIAAIQ